MRKQGRALQITNHFRTVLISFFKPHTLSLSSITTFSYSGTEEMRERDLGEEGGGEKQRCGCSQPDQWVRGGGGARKSCTFRLELTFCCRSKTIWKEEGKGWVICISLGAFLHFTSTEEFRSVKEHSLYVSTLTYRHLFWLPPSWGIFIVQWWEKWLLAGN